MGLVSMEILLGDLPNYAGGLGILAGGMLSTARDTRFNMTGFTLLYKKGYVRNRIVNGDITFEEDPMDPEEHYIKIKREFYIDLKPFRLYFNVWKYELSDDARVFLIDADHEKNPENLRDLTDRVYIERSYEETLLKRILLGLGTLEIVNKLNIPIKKFHLNESHSVFLALELLKRYKDIDKVKEKIIFTTHTPLPHGHEKYSYDFVEKYYDVPKEVKEISPDELHTTKVLFRLSSYSNAVSWKHWIITQKMFPDEKIDYITNGVHTKWVSQPLRVLYDKYIDGWFYNPERFIYAGIIPLEELKEAREVVKKKLINEIHETAYLNKKFKKEAPLIVLRRRITAYKRNDILFKDIERLEDLGKKYNLQVLISGTLQPTDVGGKEILKNIIAKMSTLNNTAVGIIMKNGKEPERLAVSGGDLFIHAPIPPMEACGTSWMRAALNAVPTLTSRDGGTLEGIVHGYNGWFFGENRFSMEPYTDDEYKKDLEEFYNVLEQILEMWKTRNEEYLSIGRNALSTIAPRFSMHRALKEYIYKGYNK